MNTVKCYHCGNTEFTVVEFRNNEHYTVSREEVDLICQKCGHVMYSVSGELEKVQTPYTWKRKFWRWIKQMKGEVL
jgi:uncharacterized Zn finger protein